MAFAPTSPQPDNFDTRPDENPNAPISLTYMPDGTYVDNQGNAVSVAPNTANSSNNSSDTDYGIEELLDELANIDPEDFNGDPDYTAITPLVCWRSCAQGGGPVAFAGEDECPSGYTAFEPDCSGRDEQVDLLIQELLAAREEAAEGSSEAEELQRQIDELKASATQPAMPLPPVEIPSITEPKKFGLGGIPPWAIIGGITLVAVIAILGRRGAPAPAPQA